MKCRKRWRISAAVIVITVIVVILTMNQKTEAKEITDMGKLSAIGSTEIRWTDAEQLAEEFAYLQFTPVKDGYITFTLNTVPEDAGERIHGVLFLCNSSKKEISSSGVSGFWNEDSFTFAVKGNHTYFLKIKLYGNTRVLVEHKYKAVKDKSGNKKSKAYKLKKNKAMSGLLMAGESKADWYKLTLSKKQVLKITVTTKSYRGIQMEVYNQKGEKIDGLSLYQPVSSDETVTLASRTSRYDGSPYKKLPKGTYYIKVYCDKTAKGCGYYSLKWK